MGNTLTVGLATYRAVTLLFADAAELAVTETHPEELALQGARARFLASVRVSEWKARFAMPSPTDRLLLAEDLHAWGSLSGLADFEMSECGGRDRYNPLIRLALCNLARQMETR